MNFIRDCELNENNGAIQSALLPFLLLLPRGLFISFLSEWLDILDVARVDSALTTRSYRPQWLQCLKNMRSMTVEGLLFSAGGNRQPWHIQHEKKSSTMLQWISRRQIYVETMSLDDLDDSFVETLQLPSLQELTIVDASERSIIHLVDTITTLRSINIRGPFNAHKGAGIRHIALNCHFLENFELCSAPTNQTKDDLLFLLAISGLQLKSVILNSLFVDGCTDDDLGRLQNYGHLFTKLSSFGNKKAMTVAGFTNFLRGCPYLKELFIQRFNDDGAILECAGQSCPLLESIYCGSFSPAAFVELRHNCKKLRCLHVNLEGHHHPLTVTAAHLEVLKQIDTLYDLKLTQCCVTEEGLVALSGFRNLKRLSIVEFGRSFQRYWSGGDLRVFTGSPINQCLEYMEIGTFEEGPLSDVTAMAAGIASCHNLRQLEFRQKAICDDDCLAAIAAGCPLLERLEVPYGHPVTMEGMNNFIIDSHHLKIVDFWWDSTDGPDYDPYDEEYDYETGFVACQVKADVAALQHRFPHIQIVHGAI